MEKDVLISIRGLQYLMDEESGEQEPVEVMTTGSYYKKNGHHFLICDAAIFDQIPVKKEVKATVSGIYITGVRGIRGSLEQPAKKNGFWQRMLRKARGEEK